MLIKLHFVSKPTVFLEYMHMKTSSLQEGLGKENKEMEEQLLNLQKSLNDISVENRQLRSELTDNKTNMAVVRTELSTYKQSYNEKVRELHL